MKTHIVRTAAAAVAATAVIGLGSGIATAEPAPGPAPVGVTQPAAPSVLNPVTLRLFGFGPLQALLTCLPTGSFAPVCRV
ncbi:MAG: hypothetical protein J2P18_01715 [Nocardia sp.]|nr:hypothetical protein [Nocardia sp.]